MTHYSVAERPIISSVTKTLVFLIKRRKILDLLLNLKLDSICQQGLTFILEPISIRSK